MISSFSKVIFCCCLYCFFSVSIVASASEQTTKFDLSNLPINQLVHLYFKEISKRPYFICSDVLEDARTVSIRASGKTLEGPLFASLLSSYGYDAHESNGITIVCKKSDAVAVVDNKTFVYTVKHRDSGYLVDLLSPLIKGTFANRRTVTGALAIGGNEKNTSPVTTPQSASTYKPSTGDDYIVFAGAEKEVEKLRGLLAQLDVPSGEVLIKAFMYEVGKSSNEASALDLVLSALSGKIQASVGAVTPGNFLRLKTNSIDLVASSLNTDGRFKVVTAPFVRLKSGKTVRLVSGNQVSLLGAIVNNQNGSTQQSFDRVESGIIFEVSPIVRGQSVDVDLFQQVSSFVNTDGGTNTPPTLNKRELRTSLTLQDGEVVVIAGLTESKEESTSSGLWFLPFPLSKGQGKKSSELILVLEIKKI